MFSFSFIAFYLLDAALLLWHCGGGIVHAWWNAKEERCEGEEMQRKENVKEGRREKKEKIYEFLSFLLFSPPSQSVSFAFHNTITHVRFHHRSAKESTQRPKDKKQ